MRRVQEDRSDRAPLRALDRHRLCGALALVLCLRLWRIKAHQNPAAVYAENCPKLAPQNTGCRGPGNTDRGKA